MASAQVLPNSAVPSRKKGHLEAGKKKLEEFRKKKAEGRAKKATSSIQSQADEVDQREKNSQNHEPVRDGAISATDNTNITNESGLIISREGETNNFQKADTGSSNYMLATSSTLVDSEHTSHDNLVQDAWKDGPSKSFESSFSDPVNDYYGRWGESNDSILIKNSKFERNNDISLEGISASVSGHTNQNTEENSNSSRFHFESQHSNFSKININDHDIRGNYMMGTPERIGVTAQNRSGFPSTSTSMFGVNGELVAGADGSMNHRSTLGGSHNSNTDNVSWHTSDLPSTDFSLSGKSIFSQQQFPSNDPVTASGRSRPSFLDSLGLSRVPSTPFKPYQDPLKANPPIFSSDSRFQSTESHSSSSTKQLFSQPNSLEQSDKLRALDSGSQKESTIDSSVASLQENQLPKMDVSDHLHWDRDLPSRKKDEDFAALEQYIEDLTQEKFSLQRALDTSRNLGESLAAENSSLTESYNQQGHVVNQLKSDIERLQDEIKAQQLALESFKSEYTNAQLECSAADERAKILASEVISLEEKSLRLRSNELKLEKQLENMTSEVTSYKRKVSSLEKERQDFQSTIDAMQEEKKLLQSKLRKASSNAGDVLKISSTKRDACTSTEDLGVADLDTVNEVTSISERTYGNRSQDMSQSMVHSSSNTSSLLAEDRSYLPDASGFIPNDQLRMIDNINSLISELSLEKEELIRALTDELSNNSKLKDLNKDLSHKLEAQTQRLELLTAQRLANDNALVKPIESQSMHDTAEYADEGDEVVERVLGWIMKLFPGGPAKRRTSKLL